MINKPFFLNESHYKDCIKLKLMIFNVIWCLLMMNSNRFSEYDLYSFTCFFKSDVVALLLFLCSHWILEYKPVYQTIVRILPLLWSRPIFDVFWCYQWLQMGFWVWIFIVLLNSFDVAALLSLLVSSVFSLYFWIKKLIVIQNPL